MTRRAFSLLEVLLALTLILALSASVYAFLFELLDRRTRIIEETDSTGGIAAVFDRVQTDLAFAVASGVAGDGGAIAGVRGDAEELSILSRAVLGPKGPDDTDHPGDLRRAVVRFDADSRRLLGRSGRAGSAENGDEFVLAEGVRAARFRFHNGSSWRESFDSRSAGGLPVLVELSIWLGDPVEPDDRETLGDDFDADMLDDDDELSPFEEPFGFAPDAAFDLDLDPGLDPELELGPPDRRRVFIVPDAGEAQPADSDQEGSFP